MASVWIAAAVLALGIVVLAYAAVRAGAEADRMCHGSARLLLRRTSLAPGWKGQGWYHHTPGPRPRPQRR